MVHMCAGIFGNELVGKRCSRFDGRVCDKWTIIPGNRCMDSMTMDRCSLCHLVRKVNADFLALRYPDDGTGHALVVHHGVDDGSWLHFPRPFSAGHVEDFGITVH